ncbi:hypothetical protein [Ewingella allii]|uniref:hypothetical protein n=1 Tax=Ewingella allii TaxID=3092550 RepID=UPI003796B56A
MTEKTDIAALLLDMRDLAERIKAAMASCVESFCMDVADSIENEIGRGLSEQEHQQISETASGLLVAQDQLEAERQQREKAEAELAALRGQKGQIAFRYRWVADEEHEASRWMYEDRPEEFDSIMKLEGAEWEEFRITPASKLTIKEAVSAYISKSAGIVVKDGE